MDIWVPCLEKKEGQRYVHVSHLSVSVGMEIGRVDVGGAEGKTEM